MRVFVKTLDEALDYGFNWSKWLAKVNDTIQSSTWTVDAGLSVAQQSNDDTTTKLWPQENTGTEGTRYACKNKITTAGGRKATRTFYIEIVAERAA